MDEKKKGLVITVELNRDLAALLCGTLQRAARQYPDSPNQQELFEKVETAVESAEGFSDA